MSMKHPGRCTPCVRVSLSPSKIPYGGFSPVRLQTERRARPSSSHDLYMPQAMVFRPVAPRGISAGLRPMALPSRGPSLGRGLCCPTASTLLWPHLRLSEPPADLCIRRRVFASRPAPRGSPLYSPCVCHRAAFLTPADRAGASGCCFPTRTSLRHLHTGSASAAPRTPVPTRLFSEAAKFT
jgi:hypothetical protein